MRHVDGAGFDNLELRRSYDLYILYISMEASELVGGRRYRDMTNGRLALNGNKR